MVKPHWVYEFMARLKAVPFKAINFFSILWKPLSFEFGVRGLKPAPTFSSTISG
jgi:hypothetical protein